MTKKSKITVSSYLVSKICERAKDLGIVLAIVNEDLDYAELTLFGDNARVLSEEIEQGKIFLKDQS